MLFVYMNYTCANVCIDKLFNLYKLKKVECLCVCVCVCVCVCEREREERRLIPLDFSTGQTLSGITSGDVFFILFLFVFILCVYVYLCVCVCVCVCVSECVCMCIWVCL